MTLHVKPATDSACGNNERCDVDARVARGPGWELRLGRWQDVLADVEAVDAVITDPPYSERTHAAYRVMPEVGRNAIGYKPFTHNDVREFCASWCARCAGWFVVHSDHVGWFWWEEQLQAHDRYAFAPVACMEPGSRVRIAGDGPAQWSVWACVARPRTREWQRWGALPGGYVVPGDEGWRGGARTGVLGSKPLWLMRAIVRDYSRPGDLIVDPCAGGATTLLAAVLEGRRAIGAEVDPATFALAVKRLEGYRGVFIDQPHGIARAPRARQQTLGFDDGGDDGAGNGGAGNGGEGA